MPTFAPPRISTAKAYSFRCPDGFGEWAICTVNDATGELHVQSDWGCWAYRWGNTFGGGKNLTQFIADRDPHASHYLADKLTSERPDGERMSRMAFSPEATVKRWGERIRERYDAGKITREQRRDLGQALKELEHETDERAFIEAWWQIDDHDLVIDGNEWDDTRSEPTSSYLVLRDAIIPALVIACRADLSLQLRDSRAEGDTAYA